MEAIQVEITKSNSDLRETRERERGGGETRYMVKAFHTILKTTLEIKILNLQNTNI